MRDRLRILGALIATPLLFVGAKHVEAQEAEEPSPATKKKTKKKATKKTAKKKATKKTARKVSEPGALGLAGAGLVAAGVAHKLGRKKKKAR